MLMPELEIKHELPKYMIPRHALVKVDRRIKTEYIDSLLSMNSYQRYLQRKIDAKNRPEEEPYRVHAEPEEDTGGFRIDE